MRKASGRSGGSSLPPTARSLRHFVIVAQGIPKGRPDLLRAQVRTKVKRTYLATYGPLLRKALDPQP